jgi:hypothetical protein
METAGKSKEQMKAEARQELQKFQAGATEPEPEQPTD